MSNTIVFLTQGGYVPAEQDELARAWSTLRLKRFLPVSDFAEECSETGEVWQYMGTVVPPVGMIVHQFRHRCATPLFPDIRREHACGHSRVLCNVAAGGLYTAF